MCRLCKGGVCISDVWVGAVWVCGNGNGVCADGLCACVA